MGCSIQWEGTLEPLKYAEEKSRNRTWRSKASERCGSKEALISKSTSVLALDIET